MISGDVAQFMQDRETLSLIVATINVELNQAAKDTVAYLAQGKITGYDKSKSFLSWAKDSIQKIAEAFKIPKK